MVVVPPGMPRTKPRALNVGLALARGALITVYDAEDRPHPEQLRAAAARYAAASPRLACLQGRLAIVHGTRLLPRLFALEYAGLFDLYNVGLGRLRLPMPLGGTSQSFPGSRLARRRWLGCLERHRGCRSRIEAGQVRLRHRRARLGHLRGGAGSPAGLAEAAAALDQGVDAGGAGSRARPLGATRPGSGQRGRGGVDARQPRDRAAGDPAGARAGGLAAMSRRSRCPHGPCWRLPCRRSRSSRAYGAAGPGCGPAASMRWLHICRCCYPTSC